MKKIKELPKNTLYFNNSSITYQNQSGDIYAVGKIEDKFEASILVVDLYKLFKLPREERSKIWRKLSAELG